MPLRAPSTPSLTPHSFADVHYYFSHPTAKPAHHRFDKGSYVYLYYNPNEHRGRVEIANYAGTPDQDAFTGCECSSLTLARLAADSCCRQISTRSRSIARISSRTCSP